ncbi:hypothetical protein GTW60_23740 [Streptomyces sp. SID4937]|nr:hypothetical protein [Streptomyces sp. SID4937]
MDPHRHVRVGGHRTVLDPLDRIRKALGVELTEPAGLSRAGLALTVWRLHRA